jgi:tetraacyldisaccharide 4'-kinase
LEQFVKERYNFCKHLKFKDHHHYTSQDLEFVKSEFGDLVNDKSILITEKDMVKWMNPHFFDLLKELPIFYLPIEVEFFQNDFSFDEWLLAKVKDRLIELEK